MRCALVTSTQLACAWRRPAGRLGVRGIEEEDRKRQRDTEGEKGRGREKRGDEKDRESENEFSPIS